MNDQPTCGTGLAEHSALPAKLAELTYSLADNLEAHLPTLDLEDENGRRERDAYVTLATEYRRIAGELEAAARRVAGYRDLPMARHVEPRFSAPGSLDAFEDFVRVEEGLLALLESALERDRLLLAEMRGTSDQSRGD